jgi:phenylpyruvate tautomerase PptA (4-oxalocrotonate tautomerase family)
MPIIDIEIVAPSVDPKLAQPLANELGYAFRAADGKVSVRLRALAPEHSAENHVAGPALPVFVTILQRHPPHNDSLDRRVASVTEAVARVTGRDPRVIHVLFEPATSGRMASGGTVVE